MGAYVCEWEQLNSPTRLMSEKDARAYYKAHQVEGDCRFALRDGHGKPEDITDAWRRLLALVQSRGKATADDRAIVDRLRMAFRAWADGRVYTHLIPNVPEPVIAKRQRTVRAHTCPNCGHVAA